MPRWMMAFGALVLSACATQPAAPSPVERGHALALAQCGACHATGRFDESRAPEAPPFRLLSQHYRVADLEESLAEGISVGHPAMPAFRFEPDDVDALVLYLQSVQEAP